MAKEDRLSDLPDSILIHILSMLREGSIRIVRTSLLSKRWQFLWMSVPVSLNFNLRDNLYDSVMQDLVNSTHRNLHFFRFFKKIRKFKLNMHYDRPEEFVRDIDLWVFFATKLANVEDFELNCESGYEFPQFAYENTSLRNLDLRFCTVNPLANVNWRGIVSLSFTGMDLTDGVMQKILSGCPNLECLKFYGCCGLHPLEISNVKLRKLIIDNSEITECDPWLDILAPYIQKLKISGWCEVIRLRNVDSLVTAVLDFNFNFEEEDPLQRKRKESTCLKELFRSIAHVEKVELGPLCIQSILELEGWQPPPSTWKFLQLSTTLRQLDFPGICSFLQSSSHLETLVIDGYKESRAQLLCYPNKDEQMKRFETHNFSGSFLHLKTIKILDLSESMLPFVKYLLKHASVLEKVFIDESLDVTMVRELLRFPRSSP
ncbi:F-box/LRR-repeat protein 25-like [Solanum lycopersicum]|uniref:F-box/LRR-repeat protein 25-like n=1 Tax=Solanum lycopersicum TaxID=4081 RepID=UPI0002BC9721|nr:F-box protein At5g03100-like [Solanum lycopersicum]